MVTVAGCLEKGETMKKRKIMFAAVIVVFCLVIFVVTRQQTSRSILGTKKMYSVFQIPEISLAQGNYSGKKLKNLSFQDKVQLFHILQKTRIYQKEKDPKYSPEDLGLWDTQILFRWDNDTKNILYWSDYQDDKTGLFTWGAVDGDDIKSYYLDKKYALKLQKLFIKYTGKNEKTFPKNSQDS